MVQGFVVVEFILADDDIGDGFLVVLCDGLCHSPDLGGDEEGELQGHGIVRDFHLGVPDRQLDLRGHQFGVLVDGDLVDGGIVLLLVLLSLLLFFLGGHASSLYICEVALFLPALISMRLGRKVLIFY